jgi:putative ABC transport system permease protein
MWGVTTEAAGVAFQSIRANKLRAALTMLGIIIGVAAVIAMVALGSGAQRAIEERISALGANLVSVYPGSHPAGGARDAANATARVPQSESQSQRARNHSEFR